MRILVLSDSHGAPRKIERAIHAQPTAEVVFHLGDGANDLDDARIEFPHIAFYQVAGNCDWCSNLSLEEMLTLDGKKIALTHGHIYGVKSGIQTYLRHGREIGADIVLFGHTHRPETGYDDGIYWMNPGSLQDNVYGIIDITAQGIVTQIVSLPRR